MMKRKLLTWQIAFTYVGAIFGAGFASGQEILRFFAVFGAKGILGTIMAGLMFALLGYIIIATAIEYGMESYEEYVLFLFGPKKAKIMDGIIILFLFAGMAVMLVASGSLWNLLWGGGSWRGFIFTAAVLYAALLTGTDGLLWLNTLLVPLLLVVCLGICFANIGNSQQMPIISPQGNLVSSSWFLASLTYVAYNLVLGTVIISSLGRAAKCGGSGGTILGGLLLGLLAAFMCLALQSNPRILEGVEIPMLEMAFKTNLLAGWSYSFILWAAVFTTALSNGYGLIRFLEAKFLWPRALLALLIILPVLPFIGWPLDRAVGIIYPLLGYLGLIFLGAVIFRLKNGIRFFF